VTDAVELDDEDRKLLVLARGASLRAHVPHTGVAAGAAVRDADGRTYAGAAVENADPALSTSALRAAVAAAASSGARRFEAAVVVSAGDFDESLGVEQLFIIYPRHFTLGVDVRRDDSDRVAGAPAVRDAQQRVDVDAQPDGPGATDALDDGARIHEHAVEIEEQRGTPDFHRPLI